MFNRYRWRDVFTDWIGKGSFSTSNLRSLCHLHRLSMTCKCTCPWFCLTDGASYKRPCTVCRCVLILHIDPCGGSYWSGYWCECWRSWCAERLRLCVSLNRWPDREMRFVPWQSPRWVVFPDSTSCSYSALQDSGKKRLKSVKGWKTLQISFANLTGFAFDIAVKLTRRPAVSSHRLREASSRSTGPSMQYRTWLPSENKRLKWSDGAGQSFMTS